MLAKGGEVRWQRIFERLFRQFHGDELKAGDKVLKLSEDSIVAARKEE